VVFCSGAARAVCSVRYSGVVFLSAWYSCGSVRCGVRVQQFYAVCWCGKRGVNQEIGGAGAVWCTGADQKFWAGALNVGWCCERGNVLETCQSSRVHYLLVAEF